MIRWCSRRAVSWSSSEPPTGSADWSWHLRVVVHPACGRHVAAFQRFRRGRFCCQQQILCHPGLRRMITSLHTCGGESMTSTGTRSPAGSRADCPTRGSPGPAEVTTDREEILVVGPLAAPEGDRGRRRRPGGDRGRARPDLPVPRGHPRRADRDRPRGRAPLRPQGRLGCGVRPGERGVHQPGGAGDDPAAPARAAGRSTPWSRPAWPAAAPTRWPGACAWSASTPRTGWAAARGDDRGAPGARGRPGRLSR